MHKLIIKTFCLLLLLFMLTFFVNINVNANFEKTVNDNVAQYNDGVNNFQL